MGSNQTVACDVRIITATHRDLEERIINGEFREDLFYRLNVFPIEIPPLRARLEDLPLLIDEVVVSLCARGCGDVRFSPGAINMLRRYPWPGNVRELANLVERMTVLHPDGEVDVAALPARYRADAAEAAPPPVEAGEEASSLPGASLAMLPPEGLNLKERVAQIEVSLIQQALEQANGVVAHAAQLLHLRRTTLVEKIRKYDLQRERDASMN